MEIQIIKDEYEIARNEFLTLDERHQILPDPEWLLWLKRRIGRSDLFLYRHKETGRFVICAWLFGPKEVQVPVAQELEGFEDPTDGWPSDLMGPEVLAARLDPLHAVAAERAENRRRKAELEQQDKNNQYDFKRSHVRTLERRGFKETAAKVQRGEIPVSPVTDDRKREWVEALSGKV